MGVAKRTHSEPLVQNEETMRYRDFGRTGLKVSALSMGCMRLSEDMDLNEKLITRCIDLGVNYFETTRYYLNGECQQRTAPGLKGKTAGVIVSGKEGIGADKSEYLFRREIDRQLDILGVDHFKFFQVGWFSWGAMPHLLKPGGVLDAIRRAQKEGLIHYVGFTSHDKPENIVKCLETGVFDSVTLPYNMINRSYEGTIARAAQLGIGVVAMCAVAGGMLATPSHRLKEAIGMDLPTPAMALRFILSNPNVSTACSGMNTLEMLEENAATVRDFDPDEGRFEEMCEGLDKLRETLGDQFCTGCRYCMDCPDGVDIPRLLGIYNSWKTWGLEDWARQELRNIPEEKRASNCTTCGKCEEKCPNELPIPRMLNELAELAG